MASPDPIRPGRARSGAIALVLLAALTLVGCGSSSDGSSTTKTEARATSSGPEVVTKGESGQKPNLATILIATDGRTPAGRLNTHYTCKGANVSPPMTWGGVPSEAKEVVVLVRTLTRGHLDTNYVLAGLSPRTTHLNAGAVPPGGIVGRNSFGQVGYSLCPPSGKPALVVFAVLGLPHKLGLTTGFNPHAVGLLVGSPGVAWGSATAFTGAGGQVIQ